MRQSAYDIIISGAGAAGLSLIWQLLESPWGRAQKILLIDRDEKQENDRTWGYWSAKPQPFDHLASFSFHHAELFGDGQHLSLPLSPYVYRVVQATDLYAAVKKRIQEADNVDWLRAEVKGFSYANDRPVVHTSSADLQAGWVFNSVFLQEELKRISASALNLMQHFKGWVIETDQPVFDSERVRLFDFRTPQYNSLRFMYVIPHSTKRALVEYTLFDGRLLKRSAYEHALRTYLQQIVGLKDYQIREEEWGIIPMTTHNFPAGIGKRIWHIGSLGGLSKPSTGYTFRRIQQHSKQLVSSLEKGEPVSAFQPPARFSLYDAALLNLLDKRGERGEAIMMRLFACNPIQRVFRFLDEETGLAEELAIMNSVQRSWFIRSLLNLSTKLPL